jgi:hypothetical protein
VIVSFHPNANDFVRRSGHGYRLVLVACDPFRASDRQSDLPDGLFPKNWETAILRDLPHAVNGRPKKF